MSIPLTSEQQSVTIVGRLGRIFHQDPPPADWMARPYVGAASRRAVDSFVSEVAIPPVSQTQTALGVPDLSPPLREDVRDIDGLAAQGADPPMTVLLMWRPTTRDVTRP